MKTPLLLALPTHLFLAAFALGGCSADESTNDDSTQKPSDSAASGAIEIGCSGPKSSGVRPANGDVALQDETSGAPSCAAQDATVTTAAYAEGEVRPRCGTPALARWDGTKCEIVYQPGADAVKVLCTGADCKALFTGELGSSADNALVACEAAFSTCK